MSRDLDIIIESLQKIMLTPEQIRAALAKQPPRGALAAVYREIGGTEEEQYTSCCADAEEAKEVDPETTNPWTGKDGNAPDEYTTTPDGVTDCETGQPVNMTFTGGFTQAESCKECGPDETWQDGFTWRPTQSPDPRYATKNLFKQYLFSSAENECFIRGEELEDYEYTTDSDTSVVLTFRCTNNSAGGWKSGYRIECTPQYYADGSCVTSPPEICGDDWQQDGVSQLTLRNGCIVGSKCDPDAAPADLGCNSCRDLCKGGVKWRFCATSDGGWVQYDPDGIRTGGKYKVGAAKIPLPPGSESDYL